LGKNICHVAIATVLGICSIAAGLAFPRTSNLEPQASSVIPSFEVATIKRNTSALPNSSSRVEPGGRLRVVGMSGLWLLAAAYGNAQGALRPEQIVGAPAWFLSDRYDIAAKTADGDVAREDVTFISLRPFLRSLLEDRFQLKTHRETRQLPIYALVRARKDGRFGPGLTPVDVDCAKEPQKCGFKGGAVSRIQADSISSDLLMQVLAGASGRIVVNRTGIAGPFRVELEYSPDQTAADKPSIFTAVQEQLGLKLEAARGPVDVVVIDHVERPTED
jgi:bla regulator protein BlaR1